MKLKKAYSKVEIRLHQSLGAANTLRMRTTTSTEQCFSQCHLAFFSKNLTNQTQTLFTDESLGKKQCKLLINKDRICQLMHCIALHCLQFVMEHSSFSFDHFCCSACEQNYFDGDPLSQMEKGCAPPKDSETPAHALMEGLKKQRRGSQGFPKNAIVDSDDGDVVEQEDYLRQKMKKQRRMSQGYVDGYKSTDDEAAAVEVQIKEDLCAQRK